MILLHLSARKKKKPRGGDLFTCGTFLIRMPELSMLCKAMDQLLSIPVSPDEGGCRVADILADMSPSGRWAFFVLLISLGFSRPMIFGSSDGAAGCSNNPTDRTGGHFSVMCAVTLRRGPVDSTSPSGDSIKCKSLGSSPPRHAVTD